MPSYTEEQKRRAVDMVEECGGSVTRAMRKLGYPTRQTLYHWLNQRDASHERRGTVNSFAQIQLAAGTATH